MRRRTLTGLFGVVVFASGLAVRPVAAETIAHWRFHAAVGSSAGTRLDDFGPHGHGLTLGRGAEMVPGRFGQALRPVRATARPDDPLPCPALVGGGAAFANVTDSKLNLGAGDWTVEFWLQLDRGATAPGVLLEIGTGPRGGNELVTQIGVRPEENAFFVTGLAPVPTTATPVVARQVEFANPEGPPGGLAVLVSASLTANQPLPRARWFHAALVHTAAGTLHLFLDGRRCASAASPQHALPRSNDGYLALGSDGRGRQLYPGLIDEVRVCDHAAYQADFMPPAGEPKNSQ